MAIWRVLPVFAAFALSGCAVNSPIVIADGATRSLGGNTINGGIHIGNDASVEGALRSLNGDLVIEDRARVASLSTVNGSIIGGENVFVGENIDSVNGGVSFDAGSKVVGEISTVNGPVALVGTAAAGIRTVHGDIELLDGSVIQEDVVIEASNGVSERVRPLRIVVSGNSVIHGDVIVEDPTLEAELIIRDGGKVFGRTQNIEAINN